MKTTAVEFGDLSASVLAVPPLARHRDLTLNLSENRKLLRYLEAGGVRTLMYGGNANFYNVPFSEYRQILEFLAGAVGGDTWIIPSAGPDFGRLMDQATVLRALPFPTAMVLPQTFPATIAGVDAGIRRFADRFGRQVVLYLKADGYLTTERIARMVQDGLVAAIKYGVVRSDPAQDAFLSELVQAVDRRLIISGIGERPAIVHLRDFGLGGFTSGSVCVAPASSTQMLRALKAGDYETAEAIRQAFLPLEDLRDRLSPIRVLHDAVSLTGVADMGPILPLLSNLDASEREPVGVAARELAAFDLRRRAA